MFPRLAKFDVWPAFFCQVKVYFGWRNVDELVAVVAREVVVRLVAEAPQLLFVVADDPARGLHADRLDHRVHVILALQAVCRNVELQHAYRAQDQVIVAQWPEHLGCALFTELHHALLQLFHLQWILEYDPTEEFRRKIRHTAVLEFLTFSEGVTDLNRAMVVQADDVARPGFFNMRAFIGLERDRISNLHGLADAHVLHLHALAVAAGADPHEGDPIAVRRVHIRLHLENEAGELFLKRPSPDLSEFHEILKDICKDVQRASNVIESMRFLLKKQEPRFEVFPLHEFVDQTLDMLRSEILGHRATVQLYIPPELPKVTGDKVQLQQVLINLLMNSLDAIKGLPKERKLIVIRARDTGYGMIMVEVIDQGQGIPAEIMPRLFEPLVTSKKDGVGLGLAISKKSLKRAVDRNGVKRLVRESFRFHQRLLAGMDLIVLCRRHLPLNDRYKLRNSLERHWMKLANKSSRQLK